jgi:hypothetical protein
MPNGVCMIGVGCLKKVLNVVGRLPRLALEVMLSSGNELLVGVIVLVVNVARVIAGSDCESLGSSLWPPLVAFGGPRCTLTNCLEGCPLTTNGGCLHVTLDQKGLNCLLARGMPGGNVEQLLHGLWLITAELMQQGLILCARPEFQDDVDVTHLGELVALPGECPNVIP